MVSSGSPPRSGVTNAQPQTPSAQTSPAATNNLIETPEPNINVAPPGLGATEPQAEDRTAWTEVLSRASAQLDRLRRMESYASDTHLEDISAALDDLRSKRESVLQDMRELELAPAGRTADIRKQLDKDLAALQNALSDSYAVAPAPSDGLPRPSPLSPSSIR
jgi:hypothetical protein